MLQDQATSEENAARFIRRVKENQMLWCLVSHSGNLAFCPSNEYEDSNVTVFWSDRAYAERHVTKEWENYEVKKISFDDFVGPYLEGLHEQEYLVGPNWDAHLFGKEMEAIDLAKVLTENE